jgi:hypothetical protein
MIDKPQNKIAPQIAELAIHDPRPFLANTHGDRLYSLKVDPTFPMVTMGDPASGAHPLARFRSREEAQRFLDRVNNALESAFLDRNEPFIPEGDPRPEAVLFALIAGVAECYVEGEYRFAILDALKKCAVEIARINRVLLP